jgi:hypothetical protein
MEIEAEHGLEVVSAADPLDILSVHRRARHWPAHVGSAADEQTGPTTSPPFAGMVNLTATTDE